MNTTTTPASRVSQASELQSIHIATKAINRIIARVDDPNIIALASVAMLHLSLLAIQKLEGVGQ
ncbi:MAG: hypothetical protein H7829_15020 [Magnetococcus sp. THC-1_WYH]